MKDDKQQTNDQPDEKPKVDLDLDAVGKTDSATNKPAKYSLDEEPIAVIDTSKYRSGLSVDEWSKLKKQNPATLTPSQKKALETADASVKQMLERVGPQLSELTKMSTAVSKSLGKFDFGSILQRAMPTLPTVPIVERYPSLIDDIDWTDAIVPPASSAEQAKQTILLERMVEAFEAQNAERSADTQKLLRPSYDAKDHKLIFANTIIDIPTGDQELVCKCLFRAGKPVSKPVGIGDVLIKLGVHSDQIKGNKRVHYAKAHLNNTVAKKVQVNDLFDIANKSIWFNQKYL